jgi:hypothetical protein
MITENALLFCKVAIDTSQLTDIFKRSVSPHVYRASGSNPIAALRSMGGFSIYPELSLAKSDALRDGLVPSLNLAGTDRVWPPQAAELRTAQENGLKAIAAAGMPKEKPILVGNLTKVLNERAGMPKISPHGTKIVTQLTGLHEGNERRLVPVAASGLKRGIDYGTPTGHVHPKVLLRDHNMATTLSGPSPVVSEAKEALRLSREINKSGVARQGMSDLEAMNKTLGRLGEFGVAPRVSRHAQTHLSEKLRGVFNSQFPEPGGRISLWKKLRDSVNLPTRAIPQPGVTRGLANLRRTEAAITGGILPKLNKWFHR